MTSSLSTIKQSCAGLVESVDAGDWTRAESELSYLSGAWQRVAAHGAASSEIATAIEDLRLRVILKNDVDQEVGPEQFAWMLTGVCAFLSQTAFSELTGQDVKSRILEVLERATGPISTSDLAEIVQRSTNAVARALPELRAQGLTKQSSSGRFAMNCITEAGRSRHAEIVADRSHAVSVSAWPTSLAQAPALDPPPVMTVDDFARADMPNDIDAVRAAG